MKISIGSDHAGFELKEELRELLSLEGFEVEDKGCNSRESCDYPDFAAPVAKDVATRKADFGLLICGSGIGMSIAANKVKGVRAALVHDRESARLSREHNNANVLCLAGRKITPEEAFKVALEFFSAKFSDAERHARRLEKVDGWSDF